MFNRGEIAVCIKLILTLFFFSLSDNAYAGDICIPAPDNLIGWWRGENNANDSISKNNGTMLNGATFTAGKVGQAFSFDGVNDYVNIPYSASLNISSSITLAAWVKHNTGSPRIYEDMVMKGNYSYGLQFDQNGNFWFVLYSSGYKTISSGVRPIAGEWYHVVGTYDGFYQRIYINGILRNTRTWSGNINTTTDPLSFGLKAGWDNNYLNGAVDEVQLYNRALSPAEIQSLNDAGLGICTAPTDTTAPDTIITIHPISPTNSDTAVFEFTASESGATFVCSLDNAAFADCTSPLNFSSLSEGNHTFAVMARDGAGNTDLTPSVVNWVIDRTPPSATVIIKPVAVTNQTTITLTIDATDVVSYIYQMDGEPISSEMVVTTPIAISNLSDGLHTLRIFGKDQAGNWQTTPTTYTWTVDTTPPQVTLTTPPAPITNANSGTITFTASETGVVCECKLDAGLFIPCSGSVSYANLTDGLHTLVIRMVDQAGNTSLMSDFTWTIDTVPPVVTVLNAPSTIINVTNITINIDITINDVVYVRYRLDNGAYSANIAAEQPIEINNLTNGPHNVCIFGQDAAGNWQPVPTCYNFAVDATKYLAYRTLADTLEVPGTRAHIQNVNDPDYDGNDWTDNGNAPEMDTSKNDNVTHVLYPYPEFTMKQANSNGLPQRDESVDLNVNDGMIPLLLVHGWQGAIGLTDPMKLTAFDNSTEKYFEEFIEYFKNTPALNSKYRLYLYKYPSYKHITYNARVLQALLGEIDYLKDNKIVIVAHSMGGLVSRSLIEEHGYSNAKKLITLATPHHGSPAAMANWIDTATIVDGWKKDLNTPGSNDLYWDNYDGIFAYAKDDLKTNIVADFETLWSTYWNLSLLYADPIWQLITSSQPMTTFSLEKLRDKGDGRISGVANFDAEYSKRYCEALSPDILSCPTGSNPSYTTYSNGVKKYMNPWLSLLNEKFKISNVGSIKYIFYAGYNETKLDSSNNIVLDNLQDISYEIPTGRVYAAGYVNDMVTTITSGLMDCSKYSYSEYNDKLFTVVYPNDAKKSALYEKELLSSDNKYIYQTQASDKSCNQVPVRLFKDYHHDRMRGDVNQNLLFGFRNDAILLSYKEQSLLNLVDAPKTKPLFDSIQFDLLYDYDNLPQKKLFVSVGGNGAGSVSSIETDGIQCGSNCEKFYDIGSTVMLTAKVNYPGVDLIRWEGCTWVDNSAEIVSAKTTTCNVVIGTELNHVTAIFADVTQPVITSNPPALSNQPSGSISFNACNCMCKLDLGDFSPCTGSFNFTGLLDGSHAFTIQALDGNGNAVQDPVIYNWTVDTTPPDITLVQNFPTIINITNITINVNINNIVTYIYQIDGSPYSAEFSANTPITINNLNEGEHVLNLIGIDATGNKQIIPTPYTFKVDLTPPTPTLVSSPPLLTNLASSSIGFTVDDPDAVCTCNLDGASSPCNGTFGFSNLSDGEHTIIIIAKDLAGNETKDPIIYKWTVDTTPPSITLVQAIPTHINAINLTVNVSLNDVVKYIYQFDGGSYSLELPADTPISLTSLSEGLHILNIIGIDAAGNQQVIATSYRFTIDRTAPKVTLVSFPPALSNITTGNLSFTVNEPGAICQCKLNMAEFAPCNSPFSFEGLAEGIQTFTIKVIDAAGNENLTASVYQWTVDATSPSTPIVSAITPTNNATPIWTWTSGGGGNGTYQVQLDSTGWMTTTSLSFQPFSVLADGSHTFYVQERDEAGNWSMIGSNAVVVDTTAPVLTLSTLSDYSWTNNETLNISGTVTDSIGVKSLTINAVDVTVNPDGSFSHALVLQSGANQITTVAEDTAGNQTTDERTITLDQAAPVLVVSLPSDNSKTNQTSIDVSGTVDQTSLVTVKVNAGAAVTPQMNNNDFSLTVTLANGINTIEVTATDQAENTASVKRTVTYDDQNPVLAITEPNQDIKTNKGSIIIKGEVSDSTAITVTITADGITYLPVVSNGTFEQAITFTTEKIYSIQVKAVDEAGNETIVQRNVVYDTTPPPFSISPVTSPTTLNSQTITGTVEAAALVAITCPTAAVGTVMYPTTTTWSVTLTGLSAGANDIAVTATDEVGNNSTLTAQIVLSSTVKVAGSAYSYPETPTYKATFSMDVTGPSAPSGWLKYYYVRTRMNFVSTGITEVSLSGNATTITGTGTVNGVAGYTFTATVTDGAPDSFGITIKKPDGSTYYSAAPGPLSGGDFVISAL